MPWSDIGLDIHEVRIGHGIKPLFTFRLWRVPILVCPLALNGLVLMTTDQKSAFRRRWFTAVGAGPCFNLIYPLIYPLVYPLVYPLIDDAPLFSANHFRTQFTPWHALFWGNV